MSEPATTAPLVDGAVHDLVRACIAADAWLGCAESMTGGQLSARIVSCPDAGSMFCGGVVSYASQVKRAVLGVTAAEVVSAEAAEQMATGVLELFGCDVALSVTGVAGPERQEGKEVGTVFVAVARRAHGASSRALALGGTPDEIRDIAIDDVIAFALEQLTGV
jgi:nicotinamide-nucleotide amidase